MAIAIGILVMVVLAAGYIWALSRLSTLSARGRLAVGGGVLLLAGGILALVAVTGIPYY